MKERERERIRLMRGTLALFGRIDQCISSLMILNRF